MQVKGAEREQGTAEPGKQGERNIAPPPRGGMLRPNDEEGPIPW